MSTRMARVVALVAAAAICLALVGLLATGLRLVAAGLPAGRGLLVVPFLSSMLTGAIVTAIAVGALAGSCAAAYVVASRRWGVHGPDWEQIVTQKGFRNAWERLHADDDRGAQRRAQRSTRDLAARHGRANDWTADAVDDRLLRILAGFNLIVLSAVLGLAVSQIVAEFDSTWWLVLASGLLAAVLIHLLVTSAGPLAAKPLVHNAVVVAIVIVALVSSPPIGLLILTGVLISTWGRSLVREHGTGPRWRLVRAPLPWLVALLYAVAGIGYLALPPVSFSGVVVKTASVEYIGGQLARSGDTVHLVLCTPLADATSTAAHLQDVTVRDGAAVASTSAAVFDQGQRPSLVGLIPSLVGVDWPRALVLPNLKARRPTCAGAPPSQTAPGWESPGLGTGAIAGPAPPGGRAVDGEPPIGQTADPRIAALARQYEPTVEVTVADYFWPVSVESVLAGIGPDGQRSCLVSPPAKPICAGITTPPASGRPSDYLRFPSTHDLAGLAITQSPTPQFQAFEAGQRTVTGSLHHWLADPGVLNPWRTAEIYFYYAGPVHFAGLAGRLPAWPAVSAVPAAVDAVASADGLIGLQYWFFYPYNYYPVAVRSSLMNGAPIAGDADNADLHQGDWEHVTVLLDQRTLKPEALYMARHANEGHFYAWNSPALAFDDGHPIVQAAIGGHPTYPNRCGDYRRSAALGLLSDWVVCGSGRFAFRAQTTPLVDLASPAARWSCWPGHFGEAKGGELVEPNGDTIANDIAKYVDVAGPVSPLWQAENGSLNSQHPVDSYGVCNQGAGAAERSALHGQSGSRLTKLYRR